MNIETFIKDWIAVGNSYNTEKYLEFYNENTVLDDPSVGRKFIGHSGIKNYFVSYFIGYKTQTELRKLEVKENSAYLEVEFKGEFPEGIIGGSFDFTFKNGKISSVKAELI
ncbi:nuclear transport factor 2 family protein [Chryseobacterium luquanense]|uniref:Nuclear transport factor 2 family protein n=1 Tax=Chryseobacterium luquanense TaxID=2983766 RepID=A0ABT3Y7Z7_9FLAO|nr:nuclear transport factor 2 family protein [Chryseobacterium luquanense]MCX8534228.1 nuclear transport factor 2 family protein [Chryseobacterium luquanense]